HVTSVQKSAPAPQPAGSTAIENGAEASVAITVGVRELRSSVQGTGASTSTSGLASRTGTSAPASCSSDVLSYVEQSNEAPAARAQDATTVSRKRRRDTIHRSYHSIASRRAALDQSILCRTSGFP